MRVIGTAGHVDHGKSTLVRALTGIDPDRLREEKERGLTIDLGFAWLTLPSGREVSIVDVPGHERFIKNMLAGAGGVDVALLVIAADEGPMPQTREHLAILDLLDVPAGIVVLAKADLVDDEYLELVEEEVAATMKGSCMAGAPIVRTSATTGLGLDELLRVLDETVDRLPPKRDLGRPRLPIDRAFTIQGFGAVVTGTLIDGALETGQEVELQPGKLRARIRGLQRHRTKVDRLEPGTRAAVNLSGVHTEELQRGMVLAKPGTLTDVYAVDVHLRATSIVEHPLAHDSGVTFLSATAESEGKVRLLDRDVLERGHEGWAQIVLETPVAVVRGDRCVIRTPNETVAGGVIVALNPRRHRRNHLPVIESLELALSGSPAERLADALHSGPVRRDRVTDQLAIGLEEAEAVLQEAVDSGGAFVSGDLVFSTVWMGSAIGRLVEIAREYLATNRLRQAAPREHVRSASGLALDAFDAVVARGVADGRLDERGAGLAPAGFAVELTEREVRAVAEYLELLRRDRFNPPTNVPLPAELTAYLDETGQVVRVGDGVVFDAGAYGEMLAGTRKFIEERGPMSLAEFRDLFGTTRKYAQAFLEHLDLQRITRRVGDTRVLR